jgi:hypothetical protein
MVRAQREDDPDANAAGETWELQIGASSKKGSPVTSSTTTHLDTRVR